MNKLDYEKYHQKGGCYLIPVEVFNELFNEIESYKEISNECLTAIKNIDDFINLYSYDDNVKFYGSLGGSFVRNIHEIVSSLLIKIINK